jgi:hypothetical protein
MPGHFMRFRETQSNPGLIIVSQDDIGAAIEDLLLTWLATDAEEWVEQVGFVPVKSTLPAINGIAFTNPH